MLNRRSSSLYLLLALLAAGCTVGERRREIIQREWPASSISRIELKEVNGSVKIEAWNGDRVTMTAEVFSRGIEPKANVENKGFFRSEVDGDTLRIGTSGRKRRHRIHWFGGSSVTVHYTLRVPATVALDIDTINGKIATRGVTGETEMTSVNGSVDLETPGAAGVRLRTVNGRVRATFFETFQGATMKTVNGSVTATLPPNASFACDLSQVNGDFEAPFPLSIHSHPGNRRVSGEVNGGRHELRITTVNGDIRLDTAASRPATAPPAVPPPPAAAPAPTT
ncbi:MAG TPA: DUF4097 family beta strand repeat-containing protein [Thermoanaerobaculia bacterium]|nr:DUF4097 family beta strand repeat-containing protein [Thermoanaerobaculia bacterium]